MKLGNKWLAAALGSLVFSGAALGADTQLSALFMAQAAYSEQDIEQMTEAFEAANPGTDVKLEFVPYEALHDKIVLSHNAADGYDVVLFDVIWPAEFARYGLLENVSDKIDSTTKGKILEGAWSTVEYDGQYYGMPWIVDTKYLFYNEAMLKKAGIDSPPATWGELVQQAKTLKEKGVVEYPLVWSWSQSEAVICDYTTLLSAMGGEFLDDKKNPVFHSGGGLKALEYMVDSIKAGLTNPNSREYSEEDVRRTFSSGQAAFALNWTYMYSLANNPEESSVAGQVRIAPALGEADISKASAVNGSMGLGIPVNSKHKDLAWKYIQHLTSMPVQEDFARLSLPVWKASYDNPEIAKGQEELLVAAKVGLAAMYPRPTKASYQEMSAALQLAIQNALLGNQSPEDALREAAETVANLD
ncbi:extracellular solute-binding protein [Aestuariispira insulae]|uniref:Carbohydrate ABC transporter substrate-binding protein (CUT1 family) n=1 Tax=Aestuariispira insulae TaxID=1461337 RepID=A0A3D9H9E5_9PROT|nr:extracellular solute-binding protein [Aestuariispira insulae]RED46105.1 carbohydrate ABC transporter substrate-binding protein (CUT1 family) [Aestuariispira insulae]